MQIRAYDGLDDLREAMEAHARAWNRAYEGLLPASVIERVTRPPTDADLRADREELTDEAGCFLVADHEDAVVGYARIRWGDTKSFVGGDEAGLKELYVDPAHWGEGVGTALLEAGFDRIPEELEAIALEVLAENDRGRAFYEARGFEVVETYTEPVAGEPIGHAIYRRPLAGQRS